MRGLAGVIAFDARIRLRAKAGLVPLLVAALGSVLLAAAFIRGAKWPAAFTDPAHRMIGQIYVNVAAALLVSLCLLVVKSGPLRRSTAAMFLAASITAIGLAWLQASA